MGLTIGFDAKRAFCNYRGLGSYSRLLIESLNEWYRDSISLVLFTPKITLKNLDNWPANWRENKNILRFFPEGVYRLTPELWRGFGQVSKWESLGLNIYHGLSNEIPYRLHNLNNKNGDKIKTVVTIHDLIFMRQPELYPWWDRLNYIRKVKYSCEAADSVIALSLQTKNDLLEYLNIPEKKIKVIYQAVHPRYYKQNLILNKTIMKDSPNEKPYFLFVGAFEDRKNILKLIKAYSNVRMKLHNHDLILIGKGGLIHEIQSLVRELSLENSVKILTQINSEELPQYYQFSTALVYPSLFEGFGLPIVEALMSETIVLTSQGGCFPESAGPGAFFVDPNDIEQMSESLISIVNLNQSERMNKISMGLEHCKKFHWRHTSEELVSHYKTL